MNDSLDSRNESLALELLPMAEEGDTVALERRTCYESGRVEWNQTEATVLSVRPDGITIQFEDQSVGWCDLDLLLGYGDARIAEDTQRSLEQFDIDASEGKA